MLILDFLYAVITSNDASALYQVKEEFLLPADKKYLTFTKAFYAKHLKFPDVVTVEKKFSIKINPNPEKPDYWRDEIIAKYKEHVVEEAIRGAAMDKSKAIEIFQKATLDSNVDLAGKIYVHDAVMRKDRYKLVKATGGITYHSTGNPDMDAFSLGYQNVDVWTIAGAEGSGKTWHLLRMIQEFDEYLMAKLLSDPILVFSCEMDADQLADRDDSLRTGIGYGKLTKGAMSPLEERRYYNYLDIKQTNVRIIDSFDNMRDIEHFITVMNPAAVYIDGSHLLAKSYDWGDIARVTADMKKIARMKKRPIINTTHLKADKGKSGKGGSIDDFAYSKGYTRDSDIAGVLFKSELMEIENKYGIDWVKFRRGERTRMIWQQDFTTMERILVESLAGQQLAAMKAASVGPGSDVDSNDLYS